MQAYTFKKEERLKSRTLIDQMFTDGQSFAVYPLRLVWIKTDALKSEYPVQFALTVAKKKFPKAAHRNRLRRRIREAWRLNKHQLYRKLNKPEGQYAFMIIYSGKEELPFVIIEAAMQKIIYRFQKKIRANQKDRE